MNTISRRAVVVAAALLTATAPAASSSPAVPPGHVPWPPASTHGKFIPYPDDVNNGYSFPACGSDIYVGPGEVSDIHYRAMVNDQGQTVVEFRGELTLDVNRLSDGAFLDEVAVSGAHLEIHTPGTTTVTYQRTGPAILASSHEVEAQAFTEAGLPATFLYLSGELSETLTYTTAPQELGQQIPPITAAQITEDTTEHVFDLCQMLDQAPKDP